MIRWMCAVSLSVIVLAQVLALAWLCFLGLAQLDFGYSFWHDYGGMAENIALYGPQNNIRPGFHLTHPTERKRLFSAIVHGIMHHGEGLETIEYSTAVDGESRRFLTPNEIIHLQDVAALIDKLTLPAWGCFALSMIGWLLAGLRWIRLPRTRARLLGGLISGAGLGVILLATGPVRVFYRLHEWVFPDGHQWFFYYQESLMSMMMKAPVLFGQIALLWGGCLLVLVVFVHLLERRFGLTS